MGWSVVVLILIIVVVVWTMAVIRNYVKRKLYPRDEDDEANFSGPMANMDGLELTDVGPPRPQEGANRPRMTSRGMPLFND